jgi:hypothetical protein
VGTETIAYTASSECTIRALRKLLDVRVDFFSRNAIEPRDVNGVPLQLTDPQRTQILKTWKNTCHSEDLQKELQLRDSLKVPEKGKGKGRSRGGAFQPAWDKGKAHGKGKRVWSGADGQKALGPNTDQVRKVKHTRWSRHLQKDFGSKAVGEFIIFTGRVNAQDA